MALFATKLFKTLLLYPPKVRSGVKGALMASVAGLSLTHTVGKAVWSGLLTSASLSCARPNAPIRPRSARCCGWCGRRRLLLVLLLAAMVSMGFDRGFEDPAVSLWMVMLGVQSLPYAATFVTATISAMSNKKVQSATVTTESPLPKAA